MGGSAERLIRTRHGGCSAAQRTIDVNAGLPGCAGPFVDVHSSPGNLVKSKSTPLDSRCQKPSRRDASVYPRIARGVFRRRASANAPVLPAPEHGERHRGHEQSGNPRHQEPGLGGGCARVLRGPAVAR